MGTTTLTATALTANTGVSCVAGGAVGTAINTSNEMRVLYPDHGRLIIWVDSDHASTAAVFQVSDFGVALGKGTLTHAVGNGGMELIMVDSDRFKQADGYVYWDWATDSAGYCHAFTVPTF